MNSTNVTILLVLGVIYKELVEQTEHSLDVYYNDRAHSDEA